MATSLIPDGVIDDFKLSGKATTLNQVLRSTDSGVTYSTVSVALDSVNNDVTLTNEAVGNCVFVSYSKKTSQAIPSQSTETISVLPKVFASNSHSITDGANATYSAKGYISIGTDVSEELAVTKTIDGIVSHTTETLIEDALKTYSIGKLDNGLACVTLHYDDSGVIDINDTTFSKTIPLNYFIKDI